jgi:hypothetical protein
MAAPSLEKTLTKDDEEARPRPDLLEDIATAIGWSYFRR